MTAFVPAGGRTEKGGPNWQRPPPKPNVCSEPSEEHEEKSGSDEFSVALPCSARSSRAKTTPPPQTAMPCVPSCTRTSGTSNILSACTDVHAEITMG